MPLDLLTLGRVSLDLFSEQAGAAFSEIRSFATSVGGSPVNIAIGASRLGLRSATLTATGDDPVGDFILRYLADENVETRYIARFTGRKTGLAVVGVEPPDRFPLVFYRDNAADWQIGLDEVQRAPITSARALLLSGTGFSQGPCRDASFAALEIAASQGGDTWLDLDLRPDQWSHPLAYGATLRRALPRLAVVIGTEEEWFAALATEPSANTWGIALTATQAEELEKILERTLAELPRLTALVKRGAKGVRILRAGAPPLDIPSLPVKIVNTVGAGDAFAAGLLASRLRGADWASAARYANACGAIVVSRAGCSAAFPRTHEVQDFLRTVGDFGETT